MGIGMEIPPVICLLLLLGSGDFRVEGLRVTGKDDPVEALRGENVTIPCLLSDVRIPLDLREVSVIWTHRLQNGTEYKISHFPGSQRDSLRPGSHMNDSDLIQGNASLFIPNIQIRDEGKYICYVIVTPNDGSTTSTLHVSVKPQNKLRYKSKIHFGLEGSVVCEVSNFYPEDVKIRWDKYSKSNGTSSSLDKDISSTLPVRNNDETFNMTSVLAMMMYRNADPGDVISCVVTHRYLKEETAVSFTVPRQSPFRNVAIAILSFLLILLVTLYLKIYKKGCRPWMDVFHCAIIIPIILLTCFLLYFMVELEGIPLWIHIPLYILLILLLATLADSGKYLWRYFKTGIPKLSAISGERWIHHKKRTTLSCQITGFRLKEIHINLYLKRRNDMKKHLIYFWVSVNGPSGEGNIKPGHQSGENIEAEPLPGDDVSDTLIPVKMEAVMTTVNGCDKCVCTFSLTPDADTDDGAVLSVEVNHAALVLPIYKYRILNVIKGHKPGLWRRSKSWRMQVMDRICNI